MDSSPTQLVLASPQRVPDYGVGQSGGRFPQQVSPIRYEQPFTQAMEEGELKNAHWPARTPKDESRWQPAPAVGVVNPTSRQSVPMAREEAAAGARRRPPTQQAGLSQANLLLPVVAQKSASASVSSRSPSMDPDGEDSDDEMESSSARNKHLPFKNFNKTERRSAHNVIEKKYRYDCDSDNVVDQPYHE